MRCVLFVAAALAVATAQGAYFKLTDTTPLCFAEEVGYGSERVIVEWFRRRANQASLDQKLSVSVVSPQTRTVVYTNRLRDSSGSFTFKPVANEMGEYDVCFSAPELEESRSVDLGVAIDHQDRKIHVDQGGDQGFSRMHPKAGPDGQEVFVFQDYDGTVKETLKTHEFITRMEKGIKAVYVGIGEVTSDLKMFHDRQVRMRQTSESTFERVWGFSVVTIAVVVVSAYMQFTFLKSFLRRKKLI